MLNRTLHFVAISVAAGILPIAQFVGLPAGPGNVAVRLSPGCLIRFIAFPVFALLSLYRPKSRSRNRVLLERMNVSAG